MTEQQKLTFTALQQRLDSLMLRDRLRFSRRLHGVKKVKNPDAQQAIFQEMAKEIDQAAGKVLLREAARPEITYPDNLPVSQKKQDILEAIRDHQVVIVAGETGSGKTTQLPKICMELGRGIKGLIGHTQPRRLAARTVANRIAEELKTEPGGCIGYKVRFSDHVSDNTMVKLMTDGILLAEIQQNSNTTYRVYDYGRRGADGKLRPLHIEKALDVTNLSPIAPTAQYPAQPVDGGSVRRLESCKYFISDVVEVSGKVHFTVGTETFRHLLALDGEAVLETASGSYPMKKGDSVLLPAGLGAYSVKGSGFRYIVTGVEEKLG